MKLYVLDFQNLKNEYTDNITDLPTTYIMVQNKKIKDYYGAPKKLKELEKMINEILSKNKDKVDQYKAGKEKLFGFFVGQVMKLSGGKANPQLTNEILKKLLKG